MVKVTATELLERRMKIKEGRAYWFANARTDPWLICCVCGVLLTGEERHKDCGRCPHDKCDSCKLAVGKNHSIVDPELITKQVSISFTKDVWSDLAIHNVFDISYPDIDKFRKPNRNRPMPIISEILLSNPEIRTLKLCSSCDLASTHRVLIFTKPVQVEWFEKE
jgi:hypothetical protein